MIRIFKHIIILVVLSLWDIPTGMSQTWLPLDKGIECFYGGSIIKNIIVDSLHDKLYASGTFVEDGNCITMRGVAQWNGSHWDSIGRGSEGAIPKLGMTMFNDTLYSCGNFYDVNTNVYVAKWNGSIWDTISNSPDAVLTFAENGSVLYMGGSFDYLGEDSTFMIKKYDGNNFLGDIPYCFTGGGKSINTMAFYQDTLYVGGDFNMLPCKPLGSLGKWDGTAFQLVSPEFANNGANCNIQAMVEYKGELYMGGYFLQVNGYAGNFIMKWNGTSFSEVGGGMNDRVTCMKVYNNKLYVGGNFTTAGGVPSNLIAMWDGANWHSLSTDTFDVASGAAPSIEAMNVYHDSLIIGGYFNSINGDIKMRRIAKYNFALTGINERYENDLINIYPNPTTNQLTIEFELTEAKSTSLEIKNVLGQTVKTISNTSILKGANKIELDISEFSKGLYFVQLQNGNKLINQKFIKE